MPSSRDATTGNKAGVGPGKPASRPRRVRPLTPVAERFAIEYCVDLHIQKAWARAHEALGLKAPSKKAHTPYRLLRDPRVQQRCQMTRIAAIKKAGITVEKTEAEIARLAYVDIGELYRPDGTFKPLHEIPEDSRRAIVGIEVEELYDFSDEEDAFARLDEADALVAQLLAAMPKPVPEPIALAVKELARWAKPKKDGKRQKYHIGRIHKVKLADKKGSLELAGRRDKLFTDKVEHGLSASLESIIAESHKVPTE